MIVVSHGCFTGDALEFLNWRVLLSRASGHGVEPMEIEDVTLIVPSVRGIQLDMDKVLGIWDSEPYDVIAVLLGHADEDGMIYPPHLEPLAVRLEEVLDALKDHTEHAVTSPAHLRELEITHQFINGLRAADAANAAVTFRNKE